MINERTINTLQYLKIISDEIYSVPHDSLNDYLKGVRDVVDIFNEYEDSSSIVDYISKQVQRIRED